MLTKQDYKVGDPGDDWLLYQHQHSNDCLSLSTSPLLHARILAALYLSPSTLGSGGSCLLVHDHAM